MSSYDITLSAATRQNLLSLQNTAALASTNQSRLSTGKKVNSALDNPVNFFTAQALNGRSSALSSLLDGISNGIQVIQAANQGITSIQKLVDQAKSIGSQALASKNTQTNGSGTTDVVDTAADGTLKFKIDGVEKDVDVKEFVAGDSTATPPTTDTGDNAASVVAKLNKAAGSNIFSISGGKLSVSANADVEITDADTQTALGLTAGASATDNATELKVEDKTRTALVGQFNALLTQIDQLAKDASYNGVNLIGSGDASNKLHVQFNENDSSGLDVQGVDLTSSGLGIDSVTSFQSDDNVNAALKQITTASGTLSAQSSTFGSNLSVVQNRQDFSNQLINVLQTGSDNLTNADMNAEAANSQALSTRQSLGISALSLANTAQQGILQLLR